MESIPLFFQGSSAATVGAPEMKEGRQSLQDTAVTDFSALLVSLLVPVQPLPDSLAAMTPQPEGTDQAAASSDTEAAPEAAVISLSVAPPASLRPRPAKDAPETDAITAVSTGMAIPVVIPREASTKPATTAKAEGSPVVATPPIRIKESVPAEGPTRQVFPDSGVLLRLVPVTQGSATEPRFRLETVQETGTMQGSAQGAEVREMPVKVISVPLSAIDNGQITLPVQLPSGEQVTLVLRDMPETASGPKDQNPAIVAQSAKRANPTELTGRNSRITGAPESPREAAQVAQQESQAPASGPISGEIIRIVLQVKPPEATAQQGPLQAATGGDNKVISLSKPSASPQEVPAQALPVQSGIPAADAVRDVPQARPTVFSSHLPEASPLRGTVENDKGVKGGVATAVAQPVPVNAGTVPEIRVLNQSSRQVEVVVQQESPVNVESAQAASQPAARTNGEKAARVEFDALEAKLPGKPEKTALLVDAVSGKDAVSALTTPAGSVERLPDQPVQSTKEASADSIIDQVMQKFSPANRAIPSPSELTVKLQPEHLGNLQMKVSVDGEQVALKIQVESPVAKQMLENNLGQLRDSFSSLGLRMDSVSVSLGMNSGWDRGHNPLWQEGRGNNAYNMGRNEPEPRRHEPSGNLNRAYPVKVDRLLDMTI